jgi:hypothetical protein
MRAFRRDLSRAASRLAQLALPSRHLIGKPCRALFLGVLMVGLLAPAADARYTNVRFGGISSPAKVAGVVVGQNLTLRMTVANLYASPSSRSDWSDLEAIPAKEMWFQVVLPLNTTFVSFSSAPGWSCSGQGVAVPAPPLPPVGSTGGNMSCWNPNPFLGVAQFSLTVQVISVGTITGYAQVTLYYPSTVTLPATLAIAARNGPPTVSSITPATGPATSPGGAQFFPSMVTITGTGFTGATSVTIGGTPLTGLSVTGTTITGELSPIHTAGSASVIVTTPLGSNPPNNLYTFVAP